MKKVLIGLFAMSSLSAFAGEMECSFYNLTTKEKVREVVYLQSFPGQGNLYDLKIKNSEGILVKVQLFLRAKNSDSTLSVNISKEELKGPSLYSSYVKYKSNPDISEFQVTPEPYLLKCLLSNSN